MAPSSRRSLSRIRVWINSGTGISSGSPKSSGSRASRMNEDAAHQVARAIAKVCARYPGSILLFERLRKIKAKGASRSRRMNRKQANHLRGKINQRAREKVFTQGSCTVE